MREWWRVMMVIYIMLVMVMMAKEDKGSFVWILFDLLNFSSIMLSLADAWQSQSLKKHRKFGGSSRLNIPG